MNKREGNFKVEAYDRRNLTVSYTHISALLLTGMCFSTHKSDILGGTLLISRGQAEFILNDI